MSDLIERQSAIDALEKVADFFPWRVPGKSETYNSYNEGWNDAIGRAEIEIETLPSAHTEIIYCKDCRKHNVNTGYKEDCCPLYEWRGVSYGHEHDYQYCCFSRRRTDE